MMQPLSNLIAVRQAFARSANVERDAASDAIAGYIPTSRALDVLRRFLAATANQHSTRAWSLTGPYGSGKSSLALVLDALTGPESADEHKIALDVLAMSDPEMAAQAQAALTDYAGPDGFIRAVATAEREPVRVTLHRALRLGAERYFSDTVIPANLSPLLDSDPREPRAALVLLEALEKQAPVLIVLDEFGKNLEFFTDHEGEADLFVLQEVAERSSGARGLRACLFTLQHLAFEDYASRASASQRREWAKIQGRFEDIPFIETTAEASRLVAGALDHSHESTTFRDLRLSWADTVLTQAADLGLSSVAAGDRDRLADCYPLHPVTLAVTPELCAKYGQNGRTLFSFLASGEPLSVKSFLEEHSDSSPLPTVMLDRVYDYFVDSASGMVGASSGATRWLEIDSRIREAHGLSREDLRCLKVVGLLNLVARGGALRASEAMVAFALTSPEASDEERATVRARLKALEASNFITYRSFADEYRIWEGTDYNIQANLDAVRGKIALTPVSTILGELYDARPQVAGRHSQEAGVLRYFSTCFADVQRTESLPVPRDEDPEDGLLIYLLGNPETVPALANLTAAGKPVVLAVAESATELEDAAREVAALKLILEDPELRPSDRVAMRELQERLASTKEQTHALLRATFSPDRITWELLGSPEILPRQRSISSVLSHACDLAYPHSPRIRNEVIARRELTTQGAKARRELIEAMLTKSAVRGLGLAGNGPEKAMYDALLEQTGLHSDRSGVWSMGDPDPTKPLGKHLAPAWKQLLTCLDAAVDQPIDGGTLYARLGAAPFGVKKGVLPIFLAAALLVRSDEVAVFQEGAYQPQLTPDLFERFVKAPAKFTFRRFDVKGAHHEVIEQLADWYTVRPNASTRRRNGTILAVTSPLLQRVRALPPYTLNTRTLPAGARAVREAITAAKDPGDLVFRALPLACGQKSMLAGATAEEAREYVITLGDYIRKLTQAYPDMLKELQQSLAEVLELPQSELRPRLRELGEQLFDSIGEPKLRSFLFSCKAPEDMEDDDWMVRVAQGLAERPPTHWKDDDRERFTANLALVAKQLRRAEALHFGEDAVEPDAMRLLVTQADGREGSRVLHPDPERLRLAEQALDNLLSSLPSGTETELAMILAQRLCSVDRSENGK